MPKSKSSGKSINSLQDHINNFIGDSISLNQFNAKVAALYLQQNTDFIENYVKTNFAGWLSSKEAYRAKEGLELLDRAGGDPGKLVTDIVKNGLKLKLDRYEDEHVAAYLDDDNYQNVLNEQKPAHLNKIFDRYNIRHRLMKINHKNYKLNDTLTSSFIKRGIENILKNNNYNLYQFRSEAPFLAFVINHSPAHHDQVSEIVDKYIERRIKESSSGYYTREFRYGLINFIKGIKDKSLRNKFAIKAIIIKDPTINKALGSYFPRYQKLINLT